MYGLAAVLFYACSPTQKTVERQSPLMSQSEYESTPLDTIGTPILSFENPYHDFGDVEKGQKRQHAFFFTNTGDADLIIEIATACTCTKIDWPRQVIRPGRRSSIPVIFDSTEKEGETLIDVDVIANTEPIVTVAQFRANVILADE